MIRLDCAVEDRNTVDVLDIPLNIAGSHPFNIHGQELLFDVLYCAS